MEATYYTKDRRIAFKVVGESTKKIFAELAAIQEVFDAESECGLCQSKDIRLLARKVDKYDFYELACTACHARFAFGQIKDSGGMLFPKRKDDDGNWLPNRGWAKFVKSETAAVPAAVPAAAPPPVASKPGNGAPKTNGVSMFPDWDAAQASSHWGDRYLMVEGKLYQLNEQTGSYQLPPKLKT